MARITWQNVTAPDLSTSRLALQQAGNSVSSGLEGFADSFRNIENIQRDEYSKAALARLAGVTSSSDLNNILANQGLSGLGIGDTRYLSNDALNSIMARPTTLFGNENTQANTANTQSMMNERNALLPGRLAQQDRNRLKDELALSSGQYAFDRLQTTNAQSDARTKNSAAVLSQIGSLNNVADAQALWPSLEESYKNNPELFTPELGALISGGAVAALKDEEGTNLTYAQAVKKANTALQAQGIAQRYATENLGLSAEENLAKLEATYGKNIPLMKQIREEFKNFDEGMFRIDPNVKSLIENDEAISSAMSSNTIAANANAAKFLDNPIWSVIEIQSSGEGLFKGKFEELQTALRDAGKDENKFWGIRNEDVLSALEQYVNKTGTNPDIVAAAILTGRGTDARSWLERAIPFKDKTIINQDYIAKEVARIRAAYTDPAAQDSYLKAVAERERIKTQRNLIQTQIDQAARAVTRGGNNTANFNSQLGNAVLGINEIMGTTNQTGSVSPADTVTTALTNATQNTTGLPGRETTEADVIAFARSFTQNAPANERPDDTTLALAIRSENGQMESRIHGPSNTPYAEMSDQQLNAIAGSGTQQERKLALAHIAARQAQKK